jgi:hypothetical protein
VAIADDAAAGAMGEGAETPPFSPADVAQLVSDMLAPALHPRKGARTNLRSRDDTVGSALPPVACSRVPVWCIPPCSLANEKPLISGGV